MLGKREDIPRLVGVHDIGIIIFAIHNIPSTERERVLAICRSTCARMVMIPDVFSGLREIVLGKNPADPGQSTVKSGEKFLALLPSLRFQTRENEGSADRQ